MFTIFFNIILNNISTDFGLWTIPSLFKKTIELITRTFQFNLALHSAKKSPAFALPNVNNIFTVKKIIPYKKNPFTQKSILNLNDEILSKISLNLATRLKISTNISF